MHSSAITHVRLLAASWFLFLSSTISACTDVGTEALYSAPEGVTVRAGSSGLFVTNNTGKTISTFVVEQRTAETLDWGPSPRCDEGSAIRNGATREISYSSIHRYYAGCTALVYWWDCANPYGGPIPSITVKTF